MKAEVEALVEELKRLRKVGVTRVNVSDAAIQSLKNFSQANAVDASTRAAVLDAMPDQVRSADVKAFDKVITATVAESKKGVVASPGGKLPPPARIDLPEGGKQRRWEALREMVLGCPVGKDRMVPGKQMTFGIGNLDAEIFFCGEAPRPEEEDQGELLVGESGGLLSRMIAAMGLKREEVYVGNIMNWRPAGSRTATIEEMAFCLPYLKAQLEIVRPKVIVALGATAVKGLLGADSFRTLRELKGEWKEFEGVPLMPTYHPSYLLSNNTNRDKRSAWEDWLKVMEKVGLPISEKQRGYFL